MSKNWRWFLVGYVWSLPLVIPFLIICVAVYGAGSWRWHDGILTCIAPKANGVTVMWGRPNGQTNGWVTCFDSEETRSHVPIRVHEATHTVQGFIFGVLWYVIYAGMFLYAYAKNPSAGWKAAYREIWFEKHAYRKQAACATDTTPWRLGESPM